MINRTLMYGQGLFETLRVYSRRRVGFLDEHIRRMAEGAAFFCIPFLEEEFLITLEKALHTISKDAEARLRITLEVYGEEGPEAYKLVAQMEPLTLPEDLYQKGVSLTLAPFKRHSQSPLTRFKTTSYLENLYARSWARTRGFYDALFLNEKGELMEASASNLFYIKGDSLITPSGECGLLPGIVRGTLLGIAGELGLRTKEERVGLDELAGAEEVFLTNSVVEVLPAREVEGIWTGTGSFYRSEALRKAYREKALAEGFEW
ncbi:MAG: aminotransferase class IV family protein [candidate division NC10 bacterium]|nr:aminotransferase class IV family protein [candidate division NC10 bacterium]